MDVVLAQHSRDLWSVSFPDAAAGDQLAVISSALLGRHRYRLWANCDGYPHDGLAVGTHDVEIRTWLPGTELEWWSGPTTIELHCPPQADPAPDVESGGDHTGTSDGDELGEMGEMGDGDEQSAVGDDKAGVRRGPAESRTGWWYSWPSFPCDDYFSIIAYWQKNPCPPPRCFP